MCMDGLIYLQHSFDCSRECQELVIEELLVSSIREDVSTLLRQLVGKAMIHLGANRGKHYLFNAYCHRW